MNQEFIGALKEIVKDKGISEDLLFTTIEDALVAAYKKNYAGPTSSAQNVKVTIDRETGEIHVYSQKVVVEEVFDNVTEIGLEEAQEIKPTYDLDDVVDFEVTPKNFGRVAAQLAKGVVTQRIREAERMERARNNDGFGPNPDGTGGSSNPFGGSSAGGSSGGGFR